MTEEDQNFYDKFPEMKIPSIKMEEANQSIKIYSGNFSLIRDNKTMTLDGTICFDWIPNEMVGFKGIVLDNQLEIIDLFNDTPEIELKIDNQTFGNCRITGTNMGAETTIEGSMINDPVLGDKSVAVSSVRFAIPNLKEFHGDPVKLTDSNRIQLCRSRIVFTNSKYQITIDGLPYSNKLKEKLSSQGGYLIQYSGEIINTSGSIQYSDLKDLISSFSCFLSFINGRRCSTLFHQGIHDGEIIWTDYSPYKLDPYKTVFTWSIYEDTSGLNDLWISFSNLWSDYNDRDFLNSVIHWYLEANKNSGYVEGSIIMAQVGLELLYNWYVIEKRKLILGKDADNISAANKIRLLLSQIKLRPDLPNRLTALVSFIVENELSDGIEAFVLIRNALVHSQEEKRKKLIKIDHAVMHETLQLGLWYLELSILKVLEYKGKYQFRCSGELWTGTNELNVP